MRARWYAQIEGTASVLYLAETQKKSGFMGGGKADFKLLAAQRSEHDWSSVPNEELIPAPDDAPYASGVLVMIELTNNRQVKRHQEAGRTLVSVLQNFSGQSKKFKSQGEEIEQWKESLTYQSQELNRREIEIETRQEQLEQAEASLKEIESQQQAVEAQKAEVAQLQEELTRKSSELEGAWAHLNGEIRQFEERQEEYQDKSAGGLSNEQADQIKSALADLGQSELGASAVANEMAATFELAAEYQSHLAEEQQRLDQKRDQLTAAQLALESQTSELIVAKQTLVEAESKLHSTQVHLQQQQSLLGAKQDHNQLLTDQLKNQTELHQRVYELLNAADKVRLSKKVDVAALEAMTEENLQALVSSLEKDLEKMIQFVNDQEEELKLQQDDIDQLKSKLTEVSDYDRLQLETEIAEEKDRHVMLNRTLVGQRRNLLEREEVLSQHRAVLLRRQGLVAEGTGAAAELEPVLDEIDKLRAALGEQIQQVEAESAQIQSELDSLKQTRQEQQQSVDEHKQVVADAESACSAQYQTVGELEGQVALCRSLLVTVEEHLSGVVHKLEAVSGAVSRWQEMEAQQQQAVAIAQQVVETLSVPEPTFA